MKNPFGTGLFDVSRFVLLIKSLYSLVCFNFLFLNDSVLVVNMFFVLFPYLMKVFNLLAYDYL